MRKVALRKESVDRNYEDVVQWGSKEVALRKESVDRNFYFLVLWLCRGWSLSARRAWIEIAEGKKAINKCEGRSPQGERG